MTRNVFKEVEETIHNPKRDHEKKDELVEILLNTKFCGIRIVRMYNGRKSPARLPKENRGINRLTYMLSKWYDQQLNGGGGVTEYVLGEERKKTLINEKFTIIH